MYKIKRLDDLEQARNDDYVKWTQFRRSWIEQIVMHKKKRILAKRILPFDKIRTQSIIPYRSSGVLMLIFEISLEFCHPSR